MTKKFWIAIALLLTCTFAEPLHAGDVKKTVDYQAYQAAYNRVLDGQWEEAGKGFEEFINTFPKSGWIDDAKFWQCYVLEKQDQLKKSAACYEVFIRKYKRSRWINDARANLIKLARRLSQNGDTKYEALIKSLQESTNEEIALMALYSLRDLSDPNVIDAALNLLDRSENTHIRTQILNILASADYTPKVAEVIKRIANQDSIKRLRVEAIYILVRKDPKTAEKILSEQIFQYDHSILEQSHGAESEETRAQKKSQEVRSHVQLLSGIAHLPDDLSIPLLTKVIQTHPDFTIRVKAHRILAPKEPQQALSLLKEIADNDHDIHHQMIIIDSLIRLPEDKGIPKIIELAQTHPNVAVRKIAIQALGSSKDPRARAALLDLAIPK